MESAKLIRKLIMSSASANQFVTRCIIYMVKNNNKKQNTQQ